MSDDARKTRGQQLLEGDRWNDYGDPRERWNLIAKGWTLILGTDVEPRKAALCMVWLKLITEAWHPKPDNLDDAEGYIEIARRLVSEHGDG